MNDRLFDRTLADWWNIACECAKKVAYSFDIRDKSLIGDPEDYAQDSIISFLDHAEGIKDNPEGYLYHIVRNRIIDDLRKSKVQNASQELLEESAFAPERKSDFLLDALDDIASQLPERLLLVVHCLLRNGVDLDEADSRKAIADSLGVEEDNLRQCLKRIRETAKLDRSESRSSSSLRNLHSTIEALSWDEALSFYK